MATSEPAVCRPNPSAADVSVTTYRRADFPSIRADWDAFASRFGYAGFSHRLAWGEVLHDALGHEPYYLAARCEGVLTAILPLVLVRSRLFGKFLVSLSYLNSAGVLGECVTSTHLVVETAVRLADALRVRHLELRSEREVPEERLSEKMTAKVHLRLALPGSTDDLMTGFKSKLRSQVKKALGNGQTVCWGSTELLNDFYQVFSRNMRDLGTPVFPRSLFGEILRRFPDAAELCVMKQDHRPAAGALLIHGPSITQVPSASALREFNATNVNMRMYWHLLERAIHRGQAGFDFGRSTVESGTYKFKEQWGALPCPAVWQYYRREGKSDEMRPDNSKYRRLIALWQRLPLWAANQIGPWIVRGIP